MSRGALPIDKDQRGPRAVGRTVKFDATAAREGRCRFPPYPPGAHLGRPPPAAAWEREAPSEPNLSKPGGRGSVRADHARLVPWTCPRLTGKLGGRAYPRAENGEIRRARLRPSRIHGHRFALSMADDLFQQEGARLLPNDSIRGREGERTREPGGFQRVRIAPPQNKPPRPGEGFGEGDAASRVRLSWRRACR